MLTLNRTNSENRDFVSLVALLDADLAVKDGTDHSFYSQFNKIDKIKYVVVAHDDATPVACGAIREFEPGIVEVKRMFVSPERRGHGIGRSILY
jgi:GNAT superfamily N-acetyltransferase